MVGREAIYAALFARLQTISGLVTVSRRLKLWSDVLPPAQPALFLAQGGQAANPRPGLPTQWRLSASIYIYAHAGNDPNAAPGPVLNPLVDAVDAALAPDQGEEKQTLNGRVTHCWISGAVETDEGVLGAQTMAIIPVEIQVN